MKLILASKSPRRKEILEKFGYEIEIMPSCYNELKLESFSSTDEIANAISNNAYGKAQDIFKKVAPSSPVIGADTVVILNNVCMNKPKNKDEAFIHLKNLSSKPHFVKTAVSIVGALGCVTKIDTSKVYFRKINKNEILDYINTFNPLDKAGSYGIQDFIKEDLEIDKNSFIQKIEGSYYNIMGICPYFLKSLLDEYNTL